MIFVTKLNNQEMLLNPDLIESVTSNPDTTILLSSGKTLIVLETMEEIRRKIILYRRETSHSPVLAVKTEEKI